MWTLLASLALAQTFDQPSRWLVGSSVELPAVMWMAADLNAEARMVSWRMELLLDCPAAETLRRGAEVRCTIEDAALSAAAHPGDAGRLLPILLELDDKLTGAEVTMRFGPRGDLRAVGLDGIEALRRRSTATRENLRLMVSRAVAGFDLPIPARDIEAGWPQRGTWMAQLPASAGTLAGGKVHHQLAGEHGGFWQIATQGRMVIEPHSAQDWPPLGQTRLVQRQESPLHPLSWDQWTGPIGMVAWFDLEIDASATVDSSTGALQVRSWAAQGRPTPSSRVANGSAGYPYWQEGALMRIDGAESVDLGPSEELEPSGPTPSALQTWESLGASW